MKKAGSDGQANTMQGNTSYRRQTGMLLIYDLFLSLYTIAIRLYAAFNDKAKKWVDGRRDWQENMRNVLRPGEERIWIHCSSMGEFEQAKPLIQVMKREFPGYKMLVTFFSPSGFEVCKNSDFADYVFYLPQDTGRNAERFVQITEPSMALFVKYEFWYHYLAQLDKHRIPVLLVSGAFRQGQPFFKWYGGVFREMLQFFTFFFLQDTESQRMLNSIDIRDNILISGDTRYDRVSAIAGSTTPIPAIEKFKDQHKILIAGSTWPGDEEVLKECLAVLPANWKLILVPHEIDDAHIKKIQQLFHGQPVLFTALDAENTGQDKRILVVNNMGMLSRIFAYGDIAFIGGGFQKGGIHNILEPAVFGLPVIFGPVYQKFVEAKELASLHYVFPVNDAGEAKEKLNELISDEPYRLTISDSLRKFMQEQIGASERIVATIRNEKWLD